MFHNKETRLNVLLDEALARHPGRTAVIDGPRRWDYRTLHGASVAAGEALAGAGVRPGDRVLIVTENCADLIAVLFGTTAIDAWPVVVSARLAPAEIDTIAAHCDARIELYLGTASDAAAEHAVRRGAASAQFGPVPAYALAGSGTPEPVPARIGDRVAAMIYTSGTTGVPKAAMLTHANMLFIGRTQCRLRGYLPQDRIYCVLPLAHVGALSSILMGMLAAGGCIHLAQRFAPEALAHALAQEEISIVAGVPSLHVRFCEWARARGGALMAPQLRMVTCASSPLDPSIKAQIEAVYGLPLQNGYGLTETAAVVCQTLIDEPRVDTSVGRPLPGVRLRFVDAGRNDVAAGEVGEILVQGPNVIPGYYRNAESTRAAFTADGWFATGDLGYMDARGDVFIAGRSKDLIKRSGYNVYPIEVETALNAHPGVAICAVVGRPRGADEEVLAFVQAREGVPLEAAELRAFLGARLAAYKRPGVIHVLADLPLLHNGKVDKTVIRRMAAALPENG